MYADGYSDQAETVKSTHVRGAHAGGEYEKKVWPGQGVHSTYEDGMVDKYSDALYKKVLGLPTPPPIPNVHGGKEAAELTAKLMRDAQGELAPKLIIDTYIHAGGKKNNTTYQALDKACGTQTAQLWLMGASTLAALWASAWDEGMGKNVKPSDIREYQPSELMPLYQNPDFLKSYYLKDIPL